MISVGTHASGAVIVKINRPKKRNALNFAMWSELASIFEDLGAREARLIVLTGDTHFCAGADISEFSNQRSERAAAALYEENVQRCYDAIYNLPVPVVAAISGVCVGGGCALALACDFRVADMTARIGIPAAKLGIIYSPFETRLLLQAVGLSCAKKVLFSGELYGAERALEMKLIDHLHQGNTIEGALSFAAGMAQNAPLSIAAAKLTLNALAEGDLSSRSAQIDELTAIATTSRDYREGVQAFLEKRAPIFIGQ